MFKMMSLLEDLISLYCNLVGFIVFEHFLFLPLEIYRFGKLSLIISNLPHSQIHFTGGSVQGMEHVSSPKQL